MFFCIKAVKAEAMHEMLKSTGFQGESQTETGTPQDEPKKNPHLPGT